MIELIKAATLSGNNTTRLQAEQAIIKMRDQQPQQFLIEASKIFSADSVEPSIRQSIGTLMVSSILQKTPVGFLWDAIFEGAKQTIKDSVLNVLLNKDRLVRRAAANVVSAICCIEIPRKQWPDIIINLAQGLKNPTIQVREVSILTLGFICERIKSRGDYSLDASEQQTILSGIVVGMKEQSAQIRDTALKALRDIIFSMTDVLSNEQYRDFVVKHIGESIENRVSCNLGIQILIEFSKLNYHYLGKYISIFYALLEPIMRNTANTDQCVLAMQFWQTVAQEFDSESEQAKGKVVQNYISGQLGKKIINILLQNLCVMSGEDDDLENPIRESAVSALARICQAGTESYKDLFINFAANTIQNGDWKLRQASVQSFTVLLVGLSQKNRQQMVSNSLLSFLKLLNDQSARVRLSTIEALVEMTDLAGICFLKHQNFINILQLIMSNVGKTQKYTKHIGSIIRNLCSAAEDNKIDTFNPIARDLISAFIQGSLTTECSLESINDSLLTIMDLIQVAKNPQTSLIYIKFVIDNIGGLQLLSGQRRRQLEAGFFTIVQTCLISLNRLHTKVDMKLLQTIYGLVIQKFRVLGDVNSDGMYVVGALTLFIEDPAVTNNFWPYIDHALKKFQQPQLFKATLSTLGDFVRHYGSSLSDKMGFIQILLSLLKDVQFNRNTKLQILQCFGQIFLFCQGSVINYLDKVMQIILMYCDGAIQMVNVDFQFSQEVKNCVLQVFTCIFHGLNNDKSQCSELEKYFQNIFKFIKITVDKINRPTINYILKAMMIVADIREVYRNKVDQFTKQQYVFQSMQNLRKFNQDNKYNKEIAYIMSKL